MDTATLVLSNTFRRKARAGLTLLGIALGVAAIVTLVSISFGLKSSALDILGKIAGDVTVMDQEELYFGSLSEEIYEKVKNTKGVKLVAPTIILWDISKGFGASGSELRGIDPEIERLFSSSIWDIKDGRALRRGDKHKILVGEVMAEQLNLEVGDGFRFLSEEFEVVGIVSFGNPLADQIGWIPIDTARDILGRPQDYINILRIKVETPGAEKAVAKRIELSTSGVVAQTSSVLSEQVSDFLSVLESVTWAISAVAAIVGGVGIANTMLMSVIERTREIGVLKAVGWSNTDVTKVILFEGIFLGILGGFFGIGIGYIVVYILKMKVSGFTAEITLRLIIQALAFALTLGIFGALYPARRAATLNPIEALR